MHFFYKCKFTEDILKENILKKSRNEKYFKGQSTSTEHCFATAWDEADGVAAGDNAAAQGAPRALAQEHS